jgi:hypothetical protein
MPAHTKEESFHTLKSVKLLKHHSYNWKGFWQQNVEYTTVAANNVSTWLFLLYVHSDFKHEISKVTTDLIIKAGVQNSHSSAMQVRWDKCGTQPAEDYTFFYGKMKENHYLRFIYVNKFNILAVKFVISRIC